MLKANKSFWFKKLFAVYNRNLLKRRFHSLNVKNFSPLEIRNKAFPLIIYANHSSWWDGLVLFEILKSDKFDSFVLMEEKQLKNFSLFRRLGAFSIVREDRKKALKSLNYAVGILKTGINKTLLIFPQGKILPNDYRPINFFNGLSYIIEKTENCSLVPCAIRYEFLNNFKPELFVSFGELEMIEVADDFERKSLTSNLENKMTANLDNLKSDIIKNNLRDFKNLF